MSGRRPLVSLLSAVDGLPKIFPGENKKALQHRGKQIAAGDWAGAAVREAVQQIQAAVIAASVAATTAAVISS